MQFYVLKMSVRDYFKAEDSESGLNFVLFDLVLNLGERTLKKTSI